MVELSSVSAAVECRDTGGGGEGAGGVAGGVVFVLELYQDRNNTILNKNNKIFKNAVPSGSLSDPAMLP